MTAKTTTNRWPASWKFEKILTRQIPPRGRQLSKTEYAALVGLASRRSDITKDLLVKPLPNSSRQGRLTRPDGSICGYAESILGMLVEMRGRK